MRNEYDILLTLPWTTPLDRDSLDDAACNVLSAVEDHGGEVALGPVVAGRYDEPAIELAFTVLAESNAEVHTKVGEVVAIIERQLGVRLASLDTSTREPCHDDSRTLALVS